MILAYRRNDCGLKYQSDRFANNITPAHAPHASILCRLAAMAYEALLLIGVLAIALLLPHILIGAFLSRVATAPILWTHIFLVLLIYFLWFWCRTGQTLAMKTWHISIIDKSGQPVRIAQALFRYLLCWMSLGLAGVGLMWALIDRDRQFLHDRLAGTRLIRS